MASRRLPPLNALRAFEAAGRLQSFTRAAEELHVTQAAISHQVKSLETYLGARLFLRMNRALRLTDEGEHFLPAITTALDGIAVATTQLARRESEGALTVSVLPSFAAGWLVPRLGGFRREHPGIDLRIDPEPDLVDFARGDVDVGVRYGRGEYPGLRSDRLMAEDIFPVCAPQLAGGRHPLREPTDLRFHTLLHDDSHGDWRTWLLAAGAENVDAERGPMFTSSSMLIQAAISGQGVALARAVLAADALASGELVRPFALGLPTEFAYYIVCLEEAAERPKVRAFREWLLVEAKGGAWPRRRDAREPGG